MLDVNIRTASPWTFNAQLDRREMRKVMRTIGRKVAKDGKSYAVKGGEYPSKLSGALQKGIRSVVSKPGFMVKVTQKMPQENKKFYPAFLIYGTKKGIPKHSSWIAKSYDINVVWAQGEINKVLQGIEL